MNTEVTEPVQADKGVKKSSIIFRVMQAAASLQQPFHESLLTVTCWKAAPQLFGLYGYENEHPSNNRVRALLAHKGGPLHRRYLEKVAPLTYRITPLGRAQLHHVSTQKQKNDKERIVRYVTPDKVKTYITRQLTSQAFTKYRSGVKESISYEMACFFLGDYIVQTSTYAGFTKRLNIRLGIYYKARSFACDGTIRLGREQVMDANQLTELEECRKYILDRFATRFRKERI
jgi:hypothetical protein